MGVDVLWLVRQEHSRTQVITYHVMVCLQDTYLSVTTWWDLQGHATGSANALVLRLVSFPGIE